MLNEKLLSILAHPVDGAVSIVTNNDDGPHLVNTWNSYITVTSERKLLILRRKLRLKLKLSLIHI